MKAAALEGEVAKKPGSSLPTGESLGAKARAVMELEEANQMEEDDDEDEVC